MTGVINLLGSPRFSLKALPLIIPSTNQVLNLEFMICLLICICRTFVISYMFVTLEHQRRSRTGPMILALYREVTNDDTRTVQRVKIRNIQLPAIRYFVYYLATS